MDLTTDFRMYFLDAYGAAGDGVTNDSGAFQACINDMPSRGGVLYLSAKNYRLNSQITINKRVTVIGQGLGDQYLLSDAGTRLITTNTNIELFVLTGGMISFEKIAFINASVTTPTSGCAIKTLAGATTSLAYSNGGIDYYEFESGYRFRDCGFSKFFCGIDFESAYLFTIDGCVFVSSYGRGIRLRNLTLPDGGDSVITNSFFFGGGGSNIGILQSSQSGIKVSGCKFNGCAKGYSGGNTYGAGSIIMFSNNSIENFSGCGAEFYGELIVFNSNQLAAYLPNPDYCIKFDNAKEVSCIGNVMKGTTVTSGGILVANSDNVLLDNVYSNFGVKPKVVITSSTNVVNRNA